MKNIINIKKGRQQTLSSNLERIEEESAQEDLEEKKRRNLRKQTLHYIFLLIAGLIVLDAYSIISLRIDLAAVVGVGIKIFGCFNKINSS